MERLGARRVVAIEANNISLLTCLVLKEATGLGAEFLHGDFLEYLKNAPETFHIIWASGVLYHSVNPGVLLEQAARVSDSLYLWTHYVSDALMQTPQAGLFEPQRNRQVEVGGVPVEYHVRSYRLNYDDLPLHYKEGRRTTPAGSRGPISWRPSAAAGISRWRSRKRGRSATCR